MVKMATTMTLTVLMLVMMAMSCNALPVSSGMAAKDPDQAVENPDHPDEEILGKVNQSSSLAGLPVAFSALLSSDLQSDGSGDYKPIPFNIVYIEEPSGIYSPATGMFTAPFTGLYAFQTSCSAQTAYSVIRLYVRGASVVNANDGVSYHDRYWSDSSISFVACVEKGDTVYVAFHHYSTNHIKGDHGSFSGFKIADTYTC